MFNKKPYITSIITVLDLDALRISLPRLRKFRGRLSLVVYNRNPNQKLSHRLVQRFGWHGRTYIINSEKTLNELESTLAAVEYIQSKKIPCDWIIFNGDTDVIIDVGVPNVNDTTFAIVQDATTIYESVTDVFKISTDWVNGAPIGKTGPHFDINGTMIRANILFEFSKFVQDMLPDIYNLLSQTKYSVPISAMLWAGLNAFVRARHPEMSPIYMNRTNYVAVQIGRTPSNNIVMRRTISATIKKFTKMIETAATQNMVADGI